jgi:hypothetical protein
MSKIQQELIGTKEAAELIGESVKSTIRRVERGDLTPVSKLPGLRGAYIFERADIEALLTPQSPPSVASPAAEGRPSPERVA